MNGVKITRDDSTRVLQAIQNMAGKHVLVGIPADNNARKDGPITNAALGYVHENGSAAHNIPPRPFLVPGMKVAAPKCADVLKGYAKKAVTGDATIDQGLNAAGLVAQSAVKNRIRSGEGFAPLQPATIAARKRQGKQGEKPLIRTGQLMNSITYVVRKK